MATLNKKQKETIETQKGFAMLTFWKLKHINVIPYKKKNFF